MAAATFVSLKGGCMSEQQIRRAIIIGGGIAGPAVGMFLRRLRIEAIVCERRSTEATDEGLFLGVAPNGMHVLGELGVQDLIEAVSVPCEGFEFRNAGGHVIATIDRRHDDDRFGARLQMIRRADLHRVLTIAARRTGVHVHVGRSLVGLDQRHPPTTVAHFMDGSQERGDIVIGCDGIQSTARRLTLPGAPGPAYSGLLDFGGFARCTVPIPIGVNVMVFGRRAFFGAFRTPADEVWWFHNSGGQRDARFRDAPAVRSHLLALHQHDPAWIRELIDSTDAIAGPFPLNDILSMPQWHRGRVCLLGDAAHATTPSAGQGASLALEDALVLAQCLRDIALPERAFEVFESVRRPRVDAIVRQSRRNGSRKAVSGPIGEWIRDRSLPFFLRLGTKAQERQYAYRLPWSHRFA
jgi:2-polyprenyl-6-methoxyphenol hydroxylase-like FAD-dependent oxidoreductase